ncbi:MAG TPA: hypothetical protein ENF75_01865 [Acidilobales archaeon]|nr:hypothetical protein [Acidilobales archaeon]
MVEEVSLEEMTRKYREIAEKEMRGEKPLRERVKEYTTINFLNPQRPFMSKQSADDTKYVINFRLVRWSELERIVGLGASNTLWYNAGKSLGELAVEKGLIKSVDDLINFVINQRIGLVDVIKESSNKTRIHVYECITCSGIPNIGRVACFFEGGLLAGVLSKLVGKCRAKETHCWGTGYSFCGFDIIFL